MASEDAKPNRTETAVRSFDDFNDSPRGGLYQSDAVARINVAVAAGAGTPFAWYGCQFHIWGKGRAHGHPLPHRVGSNLVLNHVLFNPRTLLGLNRYSCTSSRAGNPVDQLAAALTQRTIPFAFLTGYGRDALPRGFGEAIMLGKPFSQDEVLAVTAKLLRRDASVIQLRSKTI